MFFYLSYKYFLNVKPISSLQYTVYSLVSLFVEKQCLDVYRIRYSFSIQLSEEFSI